MEAIVPRLRDPKAEEPVKKRIENFDGKVALGGSGSSCLRYRHIEPAMFSSDHSFCQDGGKVGTGVHWTHPLAHA